LAPFFGGKIKKRLF
jgi:hypothetical protein